ncbi:MAG TPA: radical SAM protein [bacterium]|nr:radical SAM protein [bacterium]
MKVFFVYMGAENLGIEYLSAIAKEAGHETDLLFDPAVFSGHLMWDIPAVAKYFDLRKKIVRKILKEQPGVVAFSCFTGNYRWALSIAEEIKKEMPSIVTVFGGVHVTAVPEKVIDEPCVDVISVGEGDSVFAELLDRVERGAGLEGIPGVWHKRKGSIIKGADPETVRGLDDLPFPDKELFYSRAPVLQKQYMIMSARGCPYNCTYCYKSLSAYCRPGENPIRRRSVANVIEELEWAKGRWNVELVVFRDDVFTLNRKWLEEFSAEYKSRIDLPYFCYTHPAALNERSADLIKMSGCRFVTLGIQSVDEKQRREVLNRKYTNEQVKETVKLLKDRKITVSVDHIIGIPGDNPARLKKAAEFYCELKPDRLLTFWLTYYPGTEIMDIAQKEGLIKESDRTRIESGESGHRYSGGGASCIDKEILKAPLLFAMIPVIPHKMLKKLLSIKYENILPSGFIYHNILLFINAIRIRDPFFFYNIRFFLSKKKVP